MMASWGGIAMALMLLQADFASVFNRIFMLAV
jgi:hypothetical protein